MSSKQLVPGPMGPFDKVSLLWLVPLTVARALLAFASRSIDSSSLHWRQKLSISLLQALRRTLNPRHTFAHAHQRLTGEAVRAYCSDRGLPYAAAAVALPEHAAASADTTTVPHVPPPPPTLHIVTPANAPEDGPTLLYAHGGGYLNPLQAPGHMPFALRCAASCSARRVVFIEYALSSEHCYPAQLIQMVAAVKHLLHHPLPGTELASLTPDNLIIAGDSAGGHLIASLLAHVVHPCPYAPPLTELGPSKGKQLRAVALFSPWLTMKTTDASFTANRESDYLSAQQMDLFTELFEPSLTEVWASPIEADDAAQVWRTAFPQAAAATEAVAKRMLVTTGTGETLFDSCVRFGGELLRADMVVLDADEKVAMVAEKALVLTIAPDEAHVQPVLDSALRYAHGWSMKAADTFLKSV
ncbi:lipase/esterase, putative [Cordyceps militaris CM01]|uniref:Lipase/esterase, putative n=1 Tax=Cordyceps militaris (strain CM01) TaxID=983644 RepID=G3JP20_CORMM|nr:lipase/esterase, putative [Cordyceps militaris CM01]EGX89630.1 lipase/esterase, putative [Cordyceps militaris CM01]